MNLPWMACCSAMRYSGRQATPTAFAMFIVTETRQQAESKAMEIALDRYSVASGWMDHKVVIDPVDVDLIAEMFRL